MIYEVTNYEVDCDKCGTILEIYGTTTFLDKDAASDFALSEGWDITDDCKCFCPECAKELNLK